MKQVWHPWTEWECYASGMYDGATLLSPDEAKLAYAEFLSDTPRFEAALERVLKEWPKSCEHFLTNERINRVAWLGQAAMAIECGVSRKHRAGFMLLDEEQRSKANATAQRALERWLSEHAEKDRAVRQDLAPEGVCG